VRYLINHFRVPIVQTLYYNRYQNTRDLSEEPLALHSSHPENKRMEEPESTEVQNGLLGTNETKIQIPIESSIQISRIHVDAAADLHITSDTVPSSTSIRRKPLPPDSPYSPPSSPRASMMISQRLQTRLPETPLVNPLQPIVETPFIQDESVTRVSLGISDAAQQETLDKSKIAPSDLNYIYSPLREFGDDNRMSETSFSMRPKSFETRSRNSRRDWVILFLVILIIVLMIAILVGIGIEKSMKNGKRGEMH
jgi:hypothetical protein